MRTTCFRLVLSLFGLLINSSLCGAQNPAWDNIKQVSPGQRIRVVLNSKESVDGQFQSITDDAIIIRAHGSDQTLSRSKVQQVSSRRPGHRGRHALIGAAIGAGGGLGAGAAIDNNCSRNSIVCTGNMGKAILTPALGVLGAGIGAFLPTGGWQEIYHSN